jgi:hypothetical protein
MWNCVRGAYNSYIADQAERETGTFWVYRENTLLAQEPASASGVPEMKETSSPKRQIFDDTLSGSTVRFICSEFFQSTYEAA